MGLKSQDRQKAHLGPLLNIHTQFHFPSSIWKGVMCRTNSKNEKTRPKNYTFEAVRDEMGLKSQDPPHLGL